MTATNDILRIGLQESSLIFESFDAQMAWELGSSLKALCEQRGLAVTIEIRIARETIFFYAMPGTAPENADWARRKRNTVELMNRSSYGVGLSLQESGDSLEAMMGLPLRDYCVHGGGFPIQTRSSGYVGVVTISGLPEREDHEIVAEIMAGMCGVSIASIKLDT